MNPAEMVQRLFTTLSSSRFSSPSKLFFQTVSVPRESRRAHGTTRGVRKRDSYAARANYRGTSTID
jgi:hypothetical protein